ncbi:MAG: hypothetical protein A3C47_07400 [Omnitrophica bacterium RIFCSPHIGHO2_02_FULL_51_18]|nr:MAG: hypothetical protein A3C47_07400 [Omnitrophica bacterium RIFCSPHIGHO2_02_FULL_51_18]
MVNPTPESLLNTFRRARNKAALAGFLALLLLFPGCGPRKYTYPADKVPGSIEEISRKDYNLVVKARVVGKTVGALLYVNSILDKDGQIPKDLNEKMGKLMQVVTRVALSTDLPLEYCLVVIRDRVHPHQLMITRSLEDSKRAYADVIGVEESINRTLFGQDKYELIKDAKSTFVLKDVRHEDFLTDQIVQRVRFNYSKDAKDELDKALLMMDGSFDTSTGQRVFRFSLIALKSEDPREMVLNVFKTVNRVLEGYKYADFDAVEIQDYLNRQKLVVDRNALFDYQKKKITDQEILDRFLTESQSIQEAFKLFGFSIPQSSNDNPDAAVAATAVP